MKRNLRRSIETIVVVGTTLAVGSACSSDDGSRTEFRVPATTDAPPDMTEPEDEESASEEEEKDPITEERNAAYGAVVDDLSDECREAVEPFLPANGNGQSVIGNMSPQVVAESLMPVCAIEFLEAREGIINAILVAAKARQEES